MKTIEYEKVDFDGFQSGQIPIIEKAARFGLVPEPLVLVVKEDAFDFYMDRVYGFDFLSFPKRFDEFKFSTDLAVSTAELFQRFSDANLYHEDMHEGNVMYDVINHRVIAVDGDDVADEKMPMEEYVGDFAQIMTSLYLGYEAQDEWFVYRNKHEDLDIPDFMLKGDYISRGEFMNGNARDVVSFLLQKEGVDKKADPKVLDFILRCWDSRTQPTNFDEILVLKNFTNPVGIQTVEKM